MSTQTKTTTKKPSSTSSTAKKTPSPAAATSKVVDFNNKAIKDMQESLTTEAQKAQEKLYEMSRESAEQISKSADAAGQAFYDIANIGRENVEAFVESGNICASIAKDASQELVDYTNHTASESVEICKSFFACRTLNDVVELQNKIIKNTVEGYFEQCSRVSSATYDSANEIFEPINQRIADTTSEITKIFSGK